MDFCRAVNEIVFALMFVVAVGLGPFAGVMALFIHNLGVFSKLFSEAVEAIDPRPVEGIRATGARRLQEVVFGVIPQVMPLWSSLTLYRLETNVRSATRSASSAPAASARPSTKASAASNTPRRRRKSSSSSRPWSPSTCSARASERVLV